MHRCDGWYGARLDRLFADYGLELVRVAPGRPIPGSYWGEPEAGIIGRQVYVRNDTPLHSVLHEASHVICMDAVRRECLHTDAGGDFAEENAVCYLQIVLAGELGLAVDEIARDMDDWGYTFRLGSAHAWYKQDANDAYVWLVQNGILSAQGTPIRRLRAAHKHAG